MEGEHDGVERDRRAAAWADELEQTLCALERVALVLAVHDAELRDAVAPDLQQVHDVLQRRALASLPLEPAERRAALVDERTGPRTGSLVRATCEPPEGGESDASSDLPQQRRRGTARGI